MTRAIGAGDRATSQGQAVYFYHAVWVQDDDGVWRDLTNFIGADWCVRAELSATQDDPAMRATFTLIREQIIAGTMVSLAPQISASAANRNAANAYAPLLNPARAIRCLTATVAPGVSPAGHWKRVFDGKIDGVDPGGPQGTFTVRCRDRAAWLLDTSIETKRVYGSDAGVAVQAVMQGIINDNAVPGAPVMTTPVDPAFLITPPYSQDKVQVMAAISTLSLLIGFDLRYVFLTDGDVDPVLLFAEPPRTKTVPDWTFGPDEYTEIPRAEISDDNIRNAVTITYFDRALGQTQSVTSTNAASIAEFKRRWMEVIEPNSSQLDTSAEATRLGDAIVSDLGFPSTQHSMETMYVWFISLNDLCRFLSNSVQYDDNQDLAVSGFRHVLEGGHGTTTLDCRGTPAGAYKRWLSFGGSGGDPSRITLSWELVSQDSTTFTVRINATIIGSTILPPVELLWTGYNPPVTKLAGADPTVFVPSGSQWTFTKPTPGSGASSCGFGASAAGPLGTAFLTVPIPEASAFAGPTVDTPSLAVNPDPDNTFDVGWGVHSAPAGAKYRLYYRSGADGLSYKMVDYTVIGTATIYTIPHGSDFFHVIDPGSGGTLRTMQVYVEMYDSSGTFLVQSAVASINWHDDGFG